MPGYRVTVSDVARGIKERPPHFHNFDAQFAYRDVPDEEGKEEGI